MKAQPPTPAQQAFREDMIAAMRKHQQLRPDEMLAVAAYFVGQLIALQDQRKVTPAAALALVSANIEAGNQHAVRDLVEAPGGKA